MSAPNFFFTDSNNTDMDLTNFVWHYDDAAVETAQQASSNSTDLSEEDSNEFGFEMVLVYAFTFASVAMSTTAWTTVTSRASELWQYLWCFAMIFTATELGSDAFSVTPGSEIADVRNLAYNMFTFGSLFLIVPDTVDAIVGRHLSSVNPMLRGVVEIATEFVVIVGGLMAVAGHDWFSVQLMEHLPILVVGTTHATKVLLRDQYESIDGKLDRLHHIVAAVAGLSSYALVKLHSESEVNDILCVASIPLGIYSIYIGCVDQCTGRGAEHSTVAAIMPRLTSDTTTVVTTKGKQAAQQIKQRTTELGFTGSMP